MVLVLVVLVLLHPYSENVRSNPIAKYQDRIGTLTFFVELASMFFEYGCTLVATIMNQCNDETMNEINILNFVNCVIEMSKLHFVTQKLGLVPMKRKCLFERGALHDFLLEICLQA